MLKRICSAFLLAGIIVIFAGCGESEETVEIEEKPWLGQYVMTDELTGEFKIVTVTEETDKNVVLSFKSVRSEDEFVAVFKSSSGKYAVCNAGDRCVKFNLKSHNTSISVDDIWINKDVKRNENWTGKYEKPQEEEVVPDFGDSSWNGRYANEETGLEISVYAIKEDSVLLTYRDESSEEAVNSNLVLLINDEQNKCEYSLEGREVTLTLIKANKELEISDTSEDKNESGTNISGKYIIIK